jgi:hypothetical protein
MDMMDVRRRGIGVAQLFFSERALEEYTVKTASYFPHHPKAGSLLRWLLRKSDNKKIINMKNYPLFPPPNIRDRGVKATARNGSVKAMPRPNPKIQALRPKPKTAAFEARFALCSLSRSDKRKIIAETVEAIDTYCYADFDSE